MSYQVLVIKHNNTVVDEPCELCGQLTAPQEGPELFLEGSWAPICHKCGDDLHPPLMKALRAAQQAYNDDCTVEW